MKKFFITLMCVIMVVCFMPTVAMADETTVTVDNESGLRAAIDSDNATIKLAQNVTLTKPGDFYEFTVNVKNTGTFDANLTGITMSPLTTEQSKYLTYEIDYNGNTYTSTQTGLSISLANTSGIVPVKVKVSYVQPEKPADLPSSEVTIPLTASLTYKQA